MEPLTTIMIVVAITSAIPPLERIFKSLSAWYHKKNSKRHTISIEHNGKVSTIQYELDKIDTETLISILEELK